MIPAFNRGDSLTAGCPIIAHCLWQRAFKSGLSREGLRSATGLGVEWDGVDIHSVIADAVNPKNTPTINLDTHVYVI